MSSKNKSGLHKEISSIFSGVPLPDDKNNGPLMNMDKKDKTPGHIPPMPAAAVKGPQLKQQESSDSSAVTEKKAAPVAPKNTAATQKSAPVTQKNDNVDPKSAPTAQKNNIKTVSKKTQLKSVGKNITGYLQPIKQKLLTPPEGVSPAKHMTTLALIPVLFLVVVLVFGRLLLKSGSKSKSKEGDQTKVSSISAKDQIEWQQPEVYPVGLRDPMKRSSQQTVITVVQTNDGDDAPDSNIVVRGIAWSEDNPAVIVGTEIYYQGQIVRDVKIVKINIDSVVFEKDGKQWTQKVSN